MRHVFNLILVFCRSLPPERFQHVRRWHPGGAICPYTDYRTAGRGSSSDDKIQLRLVTRNCLASYQIGLNTAAGCSNYCVDVSGDGIVPGSFKDLLSLSKTICVLL